MRYQYEVFRMTTGEVVGIFPTHRQALHAAVKADGGKGHDTATCKVDEHFIRAVKAEMEA